MLGLLTLLALPLSFFDQISDVVENFHQPLLLVEEPPGVGKLFVPLHATPEAQVVLNSIVPLRLQPQCDRAGGACALWPVTLGAVEEFLSTLLHIDVEIDVLFQSPSKGVSASTEVPSSSSMVSVPLSLWMASSSSSSIQRGQAS